LTEAEHKDDPFAINKIHAEKIIKEELYEKIHQDDTENQPNLWKALIEDNEPENALMEKEKENIKVDVLTEIEKVKSPVKSPVQFPALHENNQENEPENPYEKHASKKSKKKTQKIPLVSNENVPSWRRELEKMYQ